MAAGELSKAEFGTFLHDFLEPSIAHVIQGGVIFICSDWRFVAQLHAVIATLNLTLITVAVWDKSTGGMRSEEHTSELQSLMRISYAVFCLKKQKHCIA